VTHDQLEALTMADRIAIMRDGLIEQVGSPHDVFAKPANVFVGSFIGTPQMNLVEAELKNYANGKAEISFGTESIVLAANAAVGKLRAGQVTVGIRPRAFSTVAKATRETITAQAELIEPMGAETLIHARTRGGRDIRVVVPRDKRVKIGETLHLQPDPAQTHVFGSDGKAVRV
jgi:multiple sugar transport system ATP-binding protein